MRVPLSLSDAFGADFERLISQFAVDQELLPDADQLRSERFLARSVIPHVERLSRLFNRMESKEEEAAADEAALTAPQRGIRPMKARRLAASAALHEKGLNPYWKDSSNPQNLRLAYFMYFMPSNLFRVASIWAELGRLGYRWPFAATTSFRGIEFGAGPASGASGIAAGEKHAQIGLPHGGDWALIEQDKAVLHLGGEWAETYFRDQGQDWTTRLFHRSIDWSQPLLPERAPKFHLWLSSYFLNESDLTPDALAERLHENWEKHLEEEGLAILVEPALRLQSRRLLALRRSLLALWERTGHTGYQILTPCLGHQACGALAKEDDWCHEEVAWWRPPYFKKIDEMAGLDRRTLPFSYLVISKSKRPRSELLPVLAGGVVTQSPELVAATEALRVANLRGRAGSPVVEDEDLNEPVAPAPGTPYVSPRAEAKAALRKIPPPSAPLPVTGPTAEGLRAYGPDAPSGDWIESEKSPGRRRLVSPAHGEGRDWEFFYCGQDGKKRARFRTEEEIGRGSILLGSEVRGDASAMRLSDVDTII